MDSTVIEQESIVELARACGKSAEVSEITERAMAGELDFEEALRKRVELLKGLSEDVLIDIYGTLKLNRGMEELAARCKGHGVPCLLISGGFEPLAKPLALRLGFLEAKANHLEVQNGILTGRLTGEIVDRRRKSTWMLEKSRELGILASDCVAIGDGANDIDMMRAAGLSVGFNPKEVLFKVCDGVMYDHRIIGDFLF
jgi:phosphoserine phosphatase